MTRTLKLSALAAGAVFAASLHAESREFRWAGRLAPGQTIELKGINGSITVELPADVSTEVRASTVNGGIDSDFPLSVKGRWGPKQAHGTLGSGGRTLELETVNGAIRLVKR